MIVEHFTRKLAQGCGICFAITILFKRGIFCSGCTIGVNTLLSSPKCTFWGGYWGKMQLAHTHVIWHKYSRNGAAAAQHAKNVERRRLRICLAPSRCSRSRSRSICKRHCCTLSAYVAKCRFVGGAALVDYARIKSFLLQESCNLF